MHPLPNDRVYFPFYGGDWIRRTTALPPAARGYYLDLINWLWDHEDRALPLQEPLLMQIARATSTREWRACWPLLRPLLAESDAGFRDPWVDDCRTRFNRFTASQSAKGKKSAAARAEKRATGVQPDSNRISTGLPTTPSTRAQLPDPDPLQNQEDQGAEPPFRSAVNGTMARWRDEPPNVRVITRIAHDVLDDVKAGRLTQVDAYEELKTRCAKFGLAYDSYAIRKAIESASWQKDHKIGAAGPVPSGAPVDAACWLVAELLKYHGGTLPRQRLNEVCFEAAHMQWPEDKAFADAVIRLAWVDDTLRLEPKWFQIDGDTVTLLNWRG